MRPDDPIFGLFAAFNADLRPHKVNLSVGVYKNADGGDQVLSCVKSAEAILSAKKLGKEYPPLLGNPLLINEGLKLVFGDDAPCLAAARVAGAQTLGGTGALRIGAEFLTRSGISKTIYLSDPTWQNHKAIFTSAGMKVDAYSYYDTLNNALNFPALCQAIRQIPPGSVLLLQPCCHNPTGISPTLEQWRELSQLIKHQQVLPFFDFAYQGFDTGIQNDAAAIRLFAAEGHELLVASSFSKNFGLYGERVGTLSILTADETVKNRVSSLLKQIVRGSYSMPPLHGGRIVAEILSTPELKQEWEQELANMRERISEMRKTLVAGLMAGGADGAFDFMTHQAGMFSFCGLNTDQVQRLRQEFGIYMPGNGRINIAGLNGYNMEYVVQSILSVQEN